MNKHIVEVIGEAASESVSQLSKQELLLRHSHQLVVTYGRKKTTLSFDYQIHKGIYRLGKSISIF